MEGGREVGREGWREGGKEGGGRTDGRKQPNHKKTTLVHTSAADPLDLRTVSTARIGPVRC